MNALTSELQGIFQLYLKLREELSKALDVGDSKDPQVLVESILRNSECLLRIEQLTPRVLRLSEEWGTDRANLDPQAQDEIRSLAAAAKTEAIRLKELCSVHAQKLRIALDKLGKDLMEIEKGSQYLKSVKPIRNNYPKFIDSRY